MSKTVKRVMTVTLIGQVAMLGANAEAHNYIFKGKLKFCSVCSVTDHKAVPNLDSHPAEVEFTLKTALVETTCRNFKDEVQPRPNQFELIVIRSARQRMSTTDILDGNERRAQVTVRLDTAFLQVSEYCLDRQYQKPVDARILKIAWAETGAWECIDPDRDSCSNRALFSTYMWNTCTLQQGGSYKCLQESSTHNE